MMMIRAGGRQKRTGSLKNGAKRGEHNNWKQISSTNQNQRRADVWVTFNALHHRSTKAHRNRAFIIFVELLPINRINRFLTKKIMTTNETKRKIVQLDVGGTLYKVSRDTLARCEGSMLAKLVSDHWKEGNSDEPIFIDRNGRLFEYVLDYLRTNKLYLPGSVSRAAVKEECEFYGISLDYDNQYFHDKAEEVIAESHQLAALNAAKKSIQLAKHKQELVFFLMIEYNKTNYPIPGRPFRIRIPEEYRHGCSCTWVQVELRKRGFELLRCCPSYRFMTIQRVLESVGEDLSTSAPGAVEMP